MMTESNKRQANCQAGQRVPVAEGLFTCISGEPHLIGSKCTKCGEVFFPAQAVCSSCSSFPTGEITFSGRGILDLYTCCRYPTPGYTGPTPYCVGFVRLPEGTKVIAPLITADIEALRTGTEMVMVLRRVGTDDAGNDVMGFAFSPV